MSFRAGDRVVVVSDRYDEARRGVAPTRGTTGTVVSASPSTVLFEADAPCPKFHRAGCAWALLTYEVELLTFDKGPLAQASEVAFDAAYATPVGVLPKDSTERKTYPMHTVIAGYFPAALAAVAHHSFVNNERHNPGEEMHWSRGKSDDHLDAAMRHLVEGDLVGLAWRALAALQLEEERKGAPIPFASK